MRKLIASGRGTPAGVGNGHLQKPSLARIPPHLLAHPNRTGMYAQVQTHRSLILLGELELIFFMKAMDHSHIRSHAARAHLLLHTTIEAY